MTTFFTADTHFRHLGAMKKFRRPFQTVHEMNQTLIANWNKVVQPADWVFHLGDFGVWGVLNLAEVLNLLKGTKVLIVGNWDNPETLGLPWRERTRSASVTVGSQRLWLSHKPRKAWNGKENGTWHLYGHVHGSKRLGGFSLDVGVDCWDFQPISFGQIRERLHALNGLSSDTAVGLPTERGSEKRGSVHFYTQRERNCSRRPTAVESVQLDSVWS